MLRLGVAIGLACAGGAHAQDTPPESRALGTPGEYILGFIQYVRWPGEERITAGQVGSDELKTEPKRAIGEMAVQLRQVGIERIRIEGHTDSLGSRVHNVELSRRRAEVVAREFVAYGFLDEAIVRKGWGFEHPVASNSTPEGRALNRRVAIVVVAAGPGPD